MCGPGFDPVVFDFSEFQHRDYINKIPIDTYFNGFMFVEAFGNHKFFTPTNDPPDNSGPNAEGGAPGAGRIVDTANPGRNDPDLKTPGYGPNNQYYMGNALIIQERRINRIDDSQFGGTIEFRLPTLMQDKLQIKKIGLLDWEVNEVVYPAVIMDSAVDGSTTTTNVEKDYLGDNSHYELDLVDAYKPVKKLKVQFSGSGALTHLKGCLKPPPEPLDPVSLEKYVTELVIPPEMPKAIYPSECEYDIAMREFKQQILPPSHPETTVWSYGSVDHEDTFNYPAFTIEAKSNQETTVCWRNELVDEDGRYLSHITPVDQTLHWANPPGGSTRRDRKGFDPEPYKGPIPMVPHVHGAHTNEYSDGYPEVRCLVELILGIVGMKSNRIVLF
jgi:hypothetical protein